MLAELHYPHNPSPWRRDDVDKLLMWASDQEASDVHIMGLTPMHMRRYNQLLQITKRPLSLSEVTELANSIAGQGSSGDVAAMQLLNPSYAIRPAPDRLYRFRLNVTGCRVQEQRSLHLVFRLIPHLPPPLETFDLPADLLDWLLIPHRNLVIVAGPTGTGKTTLMAAALRHILEDPERHEVVLLHEAPIEYVYPANRLDIVNSLAVQSEIGTDISSWRESSENILRRGPTIVLQGECRDEHTMRSTLEAALTGHAVYTTLHTRGVPASFARIARMFPSEDRATITFDAVEALHLLLSVWLVPTLDGKRRQLREYLKFTPEVREALLTCPDPAQHPVLLRQLLPDFGQTFFDDATLQHQRGVISADTLAWVRKFTQAREQAHG